MNIAIDGNEANVKNRVGSGQYTLELLKQFSKNKKHDFKILLKEKPLEDLPKENKNFKYEVFGPKKLWTQFALPIKLALGNKPDVFFSPAHYGPRFSRTPYVVTIHDLSYIHFPELFNKDDLYQLKNWSKYSIQKSTHIIAVSKSTKEDVAKHYEIKPEKITVVYEGYDKSRFKPQPQSKVKNVKNKYKIKGKYIIFIGTLQPRKNIEKLIEALSILKNQDLKLVIVGKKGWLYDKILEKSKELNIQSKVIFTGFVPDEKIPDLLGGAEVYVLPSLWEGFGIPVLEAQACNVPVVVSNTSSLPEVVGESGILIDPQNTKAIASGIERALDPKTRNTLIKKGSENIKRFSWEKCAKESLIVLEKVASK